MVKFFEGIDSGWRIWHKVETDKLYETEDSVSNCQQTSAAMDL